MTSMNGFSVGSSSSKDDRMDSVRESNRAFLVSVDLNSSIVLKFLKIPFIGIDPGGGLRSAGA